MARYGMEASGEGEGAQGPALGARRGRARRARPGPARQPLAEPGASGRLRGPRARLAGERAARCANVGVSSTAEVDRLGRRLRAVSERLERVEDAVDQLERRARASCADRLELGVEGPRRLARRGPRRPPRPSPAPASQQLLVADPPPLAAREDVADHQQAGDGDAQPRARARTAPRPPSRPRRAPASIHARRGSSEGS